MTNDPIKQKKRVWEKAAKQALKDSVFDAAPLVDLAEKRDKALIKAGQQAAYTAMRKIVEKTRYIAFGKNYPYPENKSTYYEADGYNAALKHLLYEIEKLEGENPLDSKK